MTTTQLAHNNASLERQQKIATELLMRLAPLWIRAIIPGLLGTLMVLVAFLGVPAAQLITGDASSLAVAIALLLQVSTLVLAGLFMVLRNHAALTPKQLEALTRDPRIELHVRGSIIALSRRQYAVTYHDIKSAFDMRQPAQSEIGASSTAFY